jgi:hypothetical protein
MALPEQIRKQTEAVQELYKQLNSEGTEGAENTPSSNDPSPDAGTPAENEAPAANSAATENAAPSSGTEQSNDDANSETYAQKWRTLQGMYNAEVPRLHATNRELQSRVSQMEQLLSSLSAAPSQAPASMQAPILVSDKEKEEYGESLDVMRKVSREELVPMIGKLAALENAISQIATSLNTSVVPQVQRVAQQQALSAEDRFWNSLSHLVPNWQHINNDLDFQSWLLEVDPMTGMNRQVYLEQAQQNLDVERVAAFFSTFSQATGRYQSTANAQPNRSASELEKQVSPGRGRGTNVPTGQTSRQYSPSDIKDFFNDVRQGKYKGREAERDRIERDIFAAQRDGRIVANA